MNAVNAHAVESRHGRSRNRTMVTVATRACWSRSNHSQATSAATAGSAQNASARFHPPVRSDNGKVNAAPRAAPPIMAAVHREVAKPIEFDSRSRTIPGTKPPRIAMDKPASMADSSNVTATAPANRSVKPAAIATRARLTALLLPIRPASRGTPSAKTPMPKTGTVVSAPMKASLQPVSS